LRAWLDHRRTLLAQHTAGRVQSALRARLFDRIAALGPAWFSGERTGGVMLAVVDGVEQLQTFFGVYLPQLVIAACAPVMIFAVLAWWDVPTAAVLLVAALVTLALPQLVHRADAHAALSFTVREGETVAIVGPSGAGKSTIVRLLLRQHDAQGGAIRIGGHDVHALDAGQVREMIAVVAQDATLFDGSVADNLRLGRPDASDADMIAAARAANAHDFISALPEGYATRIGERGLMLSGGQRQRIAIARALLRDAPILLLDEALSSVDAENEALIQQALDRLTRGRTTLVLAHRLSSVIGADRILVLDQGRVVDEGTHAELIVRDGPYRRLMGPQVEAAT
ncbi:ABC transporter ATP-binding protein, partial [Burkholderia anthina]|uniref:ABC transporter ATP-binding protein n=1 Tax=Burkholderia anthina TaxID=179879 RepID=UPI001ABB0582